MKKGVRSLSNLFLFSLACLTFILFSILPVLGYPSEGGGGDSETDFYTEDGNPPTSNTGVGSYWIAINQDGYAYASQNVFYKTSGSEPLRVPEEESSILSIQDDIDMGGASNSISLANLYDVFKIPDGNEIVSLEFVLDPSGYISENLKTENVADELKLSSHYPVSDPTFSGYEGPGCITCRDIDTLDCVAADNTCLIINILERSDCREMADYDQPFCEGVDGVSPNTVGVTVSAETIPGKGGCQPTEGFNAVGVSGYHAGRDWFPGDATDYAFLSEDIIFSEPKYEAEVGHCCGNDREDVGVVAKDIDSPGSYPNAYICLNDTRIDFTTGPNPLFGSMYWAYAQQSGMTYTIFPMDRKGVKFDVVSNSNNWYICDTAGGIAWYSDDIRISEYEGLPVPASVDFEGTERLEGGEDLGVDDFYESAGMPGGSGPARNDIIDEDSFSNERYLIGGAAAVTACDRDGDGYDGPWSPVRGEGVLFDELGTCDDPRQPFDCDDVLEDDEIPYLARMRHPGRIDYCIDGDPYDLDCDGDMACIDIPDPEGGVDGFFSDPSPVYLNPRFICHNEDNKGSFAECCGWDLSYCFNNDQGRREGSAIHTLREFSSYNDNSASAVAESSRDLLNSTNFVLRYGISTPPDMDDYDNVSADAVYRFSLVSTNHDLDITNWEHYKNLEFYVWFTANFEVDIWIGQYADNETDRNHPDNYVYPFKARITDYVVNEPELRKWLHVVIPIEDIFPISYSPDMVVFASNVRKLMEIGTTVNVPGIARPYSNVVGVDKIFLRPYHDQGIPGGDADNNNNMYCSGTWPPVWITDLDDNDEPENADQPGGRDACESIPSYGWTGTMCCGDDTGRNTEPGLIGPMTFQEFYADSKSACWAGNVLPDNSRIMLITYGLQYYGTGGDVVEVRRSCKNNTCIYDLPPVPGIIITNDNYDIYDLAFLSSGSEPYKPIGRGSLSPSSTSLLLAENVPMQVLYLKSETPGEDGEFWSCNAGDEDSLVHTLTDTIKSPGSLLIPEENRLTSEGATCTIKGGYFCDHIDGANKGWDDETVSVYPDPAAETDEETGNTIFKLTINDEGDEEVSPAVVPATRRVLTKTTYNLVRNGGFENV